jgi:hypothetical protein
MTQGLNPQLEQIRVNITFARRYTLRFLDTIPETEWFRMPTEGVTHVAWQVGHLAMAQYRLALERIRGNRPDDANLIRADFLQCFGRDSCVDPDPAAYPSPTAIRAVFDRVHTQVLAELPDITGGELESPPRVPHAFCSTKIECLLWCSHHEMIHGGQIGLLRRLLGQKPIW